MDARRQAGDSPLGDDVDAHSCALRTSSIAAFTFALLAAFAAPPTRADSPVTAAEITHASTTRADPAPGAPCPASSAGTTVLTKGGVLRCIPAGLLHAHVEPGAGEQARDLALGARWEAIAVAASTSRFAQPQWTDEAPAPVDRLLSCRPRSGEAGRTISLGWPRADGRLPSVGTIRVAVIPVQSPGAPAPNADNWLGQTSEWRNGRTWLEYANDLQRTMSNGRSQFAFTVTDTVTMSRPLADYDITRSNPRLPDAFNAFITDVLHAADPRVDFRRFDAVIALPSQGTIGFGPAWARRPGTGVTVDGVELLNGTVIGDENRYTAPSEIVVHEFGHLLAIPDLYARDQLINRYVGTMSQMGNAYQFRGVTGYEKWLMRWIPESRVACVKASPKAPTSVTLSSVSAPVTAAKPQNPLIAVVPRGNGRVVVVEYRTRQGLDAALTRPGVHVYSIDVSKPSMGGPMVSYRPDSSTLQPLADTSNAEAVTAAYFAMQDSIDAALLQPGQSATHEGVRITVPDLPQQRPGSLAADRGPARVTVQIQRAR